MIRAGLALLLLAQAQPPDYRGSYTVSIGDAALGYPGPAKDDPIAKLQARLESGAVKLEWDEKHGYLPAILKALKIPVSSQGLVFSKTSFQAPLISPASPRAIYFGDSVYVGVVPKGPVLELSAADPARGGFFYTLEQKRVTRPQIERGDGCLGCHVSPNTTGVPGHLVRSVYPDAAGFPMGTVGSFVTDHRSPFAERWGGWYVTGTHGKARHMGNVVVKDPGKPEALDREAGANVTSLQGLVDTRPYLSPHSDIVALMVLEHETKLHNLFTRAGYEVRAAMTLQGEMNKAMGRPADELSESTARRIENAAEILVRYLLFLDEPRLESPVRGTSGFAKEFGARGGLREFDLETRLFRYRCSFLIDSESFRALPDVLRARVWARIDAVMAAPEWAGTRAVLAAAVKR
ncbi:MAG: hypothetical protein IPP47_32140 [Bryobacterales bacterium]|nr:hypothetical protein [Bryobacterales bacterium]